MGVIEIKQAIEEMSKACHDEWMDWSKDISKDFTLVLDVLNEDIEFFKENGVENNEAIELVQKLKSRLERWKSLWIPYEELSEEMKDIDREYAIKMFNIAKKSLKE